MVLGNIPTLLPNSKGRRFMSAACLRSLLKRTQSYHWDTKTASTKVGWSLTVRALEIKQRGGTISGTSQQSRDNAGQQSSRYLRAV
eukprot:2862529-Pyramimonas_sp.AAC.1